MNVLRAPRKMGECSLGLAFCNKYAIIILDKKRRSSEPWWLYQNVAYFIFIDDILLEKS